MLYCSISWLDFPPESRLLGAWRVKIERATNLPPMDINYTSDPYCVVMATNNTGQEFRQPTCVKARTLNPQWDEVIEIPVCKTTNDLSLNSAFESNGISSIADHDMPDFFQWDKKRVFQDHIVDQKIMERWTKLLTKADLKE